MKNQHFAPGSDNVFQDLGYDRPKDMQRKSDLVQTLNLLIKQLGISNSELFTKFGIPLQSLRLISEGKFSNISESDISIYIDKLKNNSPSK